MQRKTVRALCAGSLLCCWGLAIPEARAQIVEPSCYVDVDSTAPTPDGQSWLTAYRDVQDAIQDPSCNVVWVAAGTYVPSVIPPGGGSDPRRVTFSPNDAQAFYGGFDGTEDWTTFDLSERDFVANETILSGDIGELENNADNAYHVVRVDTDGPFLGLYTLDGFTISGGNANGVHDVDTRGGGIRNFRTVMQLRHCVVKNNKAAGMGGGVFLSQSYTVFQDSLFEGNQALLGSSDLPQGGAVAAIAFTSPDFTGCVFRENVSEAEGGALFFFFQSLMEIGDIEIEDSLFDGNVAGTDGGAIYCLSNNTLQDPPEGPFVDPFLRIRRTDFYRNRAQTHGAAFYLEGRNARLENCKFAGNLAINQAGVATGAAIHAETSDEQQPALVAINCLFTGNVAQASSDAVGALYLTRWLSGNPPEFHDSTANFYNCTFSRNDATGGVGHTDYSEVQVDRGDVNFNNCIFWNDDAGVAASDEIDAVVQPFDGGLVTFRNSIVEGGLPTGATDGGSNLSDDPAYVDSDGPNDAPGDEDDDLHLDPASPAIEVGANDLIPTDLYDIDEDGITAECFPVDMNGCARLAGPTSPTIAIVDMGIYEEGSAVDEFGNCTNLAEFDCDENGWLDSCVGSGISGDCDGLGEWDVCQIANDPTADQDGDGAIDLCQPQISHDAEDISFNDHAFGGYIDARAESTDGLKVDLGLTQITVVFTEQVAGHLDDPDLLDEDDFLVHVTGGNAPAITAVNSTQNPRVVLTLSDIIPLQEWTTIEAADTLYSSATFLRLLKLGDGGPGCDEPDRVDIAYLPCDVNQNSQCEPFDLLLFRQAAIGQVHPAKGVLTDYFDTNRNGQFLDPPDPFDLLLFRQLVNGVPPATKAWDGEKLLHARP